MADKINPNDITALILADRPVEGWEDAFRPMAQIAGTTMIKKQIATLRKAGLSSLVVLTGYQHEALERHLAHLSVTCLFHPHFRDNDPILSLQEACRQLFENQAGEEKEKSLLVLPVDAPLFSPDTVKDLLSEPGDAVIPVSSDREGVPVVLRGAAIKCLVHAKGGEKLTDFLRENECSLSCMETEDEGCFLRYHSPEDYERMQKYAADQKTANSLTFHCKISLQKQEDFFGPGTACFLNMVDSKGSMLAACEEMHMSYSKGWKMVRQVEEQMGFPFLIRQTGGKDGGSSKLTEEGRDFVKRYLALQADLRRTAEAFFSLYFSDFQ